MLPLNTDKVLRIHMDPVCHRIPKRRNQTVLKFTAFGPGTHTAVMCSRSNPRHLTFMLIG